MTLQTTAPTVQQKTGYRYVKYTFFKVDPAWRKVSRQARGSLKKRFLSTLNEAGDKTELGKYLSTPYSYLAMLRPSEYFGRHSERDPVGSKYLFVYPFTKKREWYSVPFEERRRIMKDHVQAGQKYPSVTIHTSYSFGIDDYEFILSFETDHPEDFLNLVMDLRTTEASKYTALETPIFTCLNVEPEKMLDLLGP